MSNEVWEYIVLRTVSDPGGRSLYQPGEGIMAQVVQDLGLVVGEDVKPARPNSMPQPAGNASRAEWARYAEIQGMPQDEVDGSTRDQLRDTYTKAAETDEAGDFAEPAEEE